MDTVNVKSCLLCPYCARISEKYQKLPKLPYNVEVSEQYPMKVINAVNWDALLLHSSNDKGYFLDISIPFYLFLSLYLCL